MKKAAQNNIQYEIDVVPNEHGGFYAHIPALPGIVTGGASPEEALRNAREAAGLMLDEMEDRGQEPPPPLGGFSGQFNVRVPRSLHARLVRRAEREAVSLNALVSYLLSSATEGKTRKMARSNTKPVRRR
ncbi:MAG: type II toxin-antitoxin system HicB family antitoxin [Deltaproteobacteria bacterium]|nr:type II toxin-antitoxin system HicB family antitoxin [Deltaproteobacteria bacterium]